MCTWISLTTYCLSTMYIISFCIKISVHTIDLHVSVYGNVYIALSLHCVSIVYIYLLYKH